ncbi:hypothetical protein [Streptomyces griseosporeus]
MDEEPGTPGPAPGGLRIPPVVLKILVTVSVGTLTYVLTNLIDQSQEQLWQLALAVVIGGAVLIVQYMVDFEQRLGTVEVGQQRSGRHMAQLVDRGFSRVSEVTELFTALDAAGMPSHEVARLARSAAQVGAHGDGFLEKFVQAEITRLARMVTELTSQSADWPGENNDLLIELTRSARKSIHATSSFVETAFWDTATAAYYLEVQREAIQEHGVEIKRLFMVKDREGLNDKLRHILELQQDAGIEVGVVVLPELPPRISAGATLDVVIFDEELYYEITHDVQGRNPSARLDAHGAQVARRMSRFGRLWDARLRTDAD